MTPTGPNEHPWIVMTEYTVDDGCQGVGYEGEDTASSRSSLTFGGSSSDSEYATTNETSGKDNFISATNANGLAYSGGPPYGPQIRHGNSQEEIRSQDAANSHARPRSGQRSVPQSFDQAGASQQYGSSPTSIDLEARVPRAFEDFQGMDLIELFPHRFDGKPQAKVEEWVQRCKRSGAGLPCIDMSTEDAPVTRDRQGDNNSPESKTQDRDNDKRYLSDSSDGSETALRQNRSENGVQKSNGKDGEASKEKEL
ncbi:hypothetical protein IFR05_014161 [Cadophora sp. M221]|nr:hypothetical protein IFR05_014161 [Cadophora sp. M221]